MAFIFVLLRERARKKKEEEEKRMEREREKVLLNFLMNFPFVIFVVHSDSPFCIFIYNRNCEKHPVMAKDVHSHA